MDQIWLNAHHLSIASLPHPSLTPHRLKEVYIVSESKNTFSSWLKTHKEAEFPVVLLRPIRTPAPSSSSSSPTPFHEKMSVKTQKRPQGEDGMKQRKPWGGEGRRTDKACLLFSFISPFLFFSFLSAANSCQDQWPRYQGCMKRVHFSSTRGSRPRP